MKQCFYLLIVLSFVLSACATPSSAKQSAPIEVTNAWVRTVGGMRSLSGSDTALFMAIQNNTDVTDKLVQVESDVAEMIQIHLSEIDANNISSMHEVEGIEIPAQGGVELKPGSYHIMLMGLRRDLKEGDRVTFTLTFQNAGSIVIQAPVKTP